MSPNGFYHQTQNDFADFVGAERIEEGAHWCDCLPEEAQKPWDWLPKEEVKP